VPQKRIGESAGGRAHVKAYAAIHPDLEHHQRRLELFAATRHETRPRDHLDRDVYFYRLTRLAIDATAIAFADTNLTRTQEPRSLVAVFRKTPIDQQIVEPDLAR
jgi:hypothetical protein